jgi:hypothetical protein
MWLASLDTTASARVVARSALRYDAALALQVGVGWVRAGSALARFGKRLMMVQDDALWLAWWDEQGTLRAEPLPPDERGQRVFSDKRRKPDFEAAVVVGQRLVVFGSGSLPMRERIALVEAGGSGQVLAVPALYGVLRGEPGFAGGQLNIEGALVEHDRLVLFSRGNAAAFASDQGFDASIELDVSQLELYLAAPTTASPPTLRNLQQYRLGEIGSVRLTLTDAALRDGRRFYVAAAEASPDAVADGQVLGTSFGVLDAQPRYAHIETEDGSPLRDKVEGLAPGEHAGEWLAITDPDDAARPAELLTLRVSGF